MPSPRPSSPIARALFWLANAVYNNRRVFLYPQLVLAVICIVYTVFKLEFLTDRNALVGSEQEYHRKFLRFREEFPVQDDLVVVAESDSIERNRQFVERLGARLRAEPDLFGSVFYKADLSMLGPKALFFLSESDLRELLNSLREYQPVLQQFSKANNLVSLLNLVNTQFRTASREPSSGGEALAKALPAFERIVIQATDAVQRPGAPPSPGVTALFEGGKEAEAQMYITFASNRVFLLTAQARTADLTEKAVKRMRELISQTILEVPGLNVGLTGEPVLEVDEMLQSQSDTTKATIISLVAVALIFIFGYHETGRPLKATFCLLIGLAYTMGYTTLVVGHLNILTITFVPILVGMAIDFGVHLITRYEEELRRGRTEYQALDKAIVFTGLGIFTGAFTTAGAFFAMAVPDFRGIKEMGIIVGGGMLVCLVPMMTLLPVLLLRGRQNIVDQELGPVLEHREAKEIDRRARIENMWLRRPWLTIAITLAITTWALLPARSVRFDYNLLNMQSRDLPAVLFQDKLIESSNRSVLFGAVIADSLVQATNLITALTNLPSVASVESMATFLADNQAAKLQLIREVKQLMAQLHFAEVDLEPAEIIALRRSVWSLHGYCGLAAKAIKHEEPVIAQQLLDLRGALKKFIDQLLRTNPEISSKKLAIFQQALFEDVHTTFGAIRNQDDSGPLTVRDLPEALRTRFVGVTGKLLIQVYPKENIWNRAEQERFIKEIATVYPDVTGTPVQLYHYTKLLRDSFVQAGYYSLIAIAGLVFIHFRKLSSVILSLLPVLFGFIWMVGLMGVMDVPFNPANVMTLPLIVGIGVTNGIHILNRYAEELHPSILAKSTGKAVLVSGLTTIAGFGSLIIAEHRGIRSLGIIMSIGVATCMIVGLTFLPALLNVLSQHGWSIRKKTQRDNAQSTLGREEPR